MKKLPFLLILMTFIGAEAQIRINPSPVTTEKVNTVNTPKPVAFRLTGYSNLSLPANASGNGTTLNLTVKEFDLSNATKGASFVAPETAVYHFDAHLNFSPALTDYQNYSRFHMLLLKGSGTVIERTSLMNPQTALTPFHTLSISTTVLLNKGETVYVAYNADANPNTGSVSTNSVSFSGFKISDFIGGASGGTIR